MLYLHILKLLYNSNDNYCDINIHAHIIAFNESFATHYSSNTYSGSGGIYTNPPYNKGAYASFDPENQNVCKFTPFDKIYHSPDEFSDNPMDSNWTGRGIPIGGDTVNRTRSSPDETTGNPTDNNWDGSVNSD